MKRLLASTTALALVLTSVPAVPLWSQALDADGRVVLEDGTVVCTPAEGAPCDLDAIVTDMAAQAEAARAAADAIAAQAAADAAAVEAAATAAAEAA
ncbi:MAG: hypothetical protein ACK4L4_06455, partial [Gemmobacter sp.]